MSSSVQSLDFYNEKRKEKKNNIKAPYILRTNLVAWERAVVAAYETVFHFESVPRVVQERTEGKDT